MTAIADALAGESAALVVRALLDFRSLWTTHDLVSTTGVPAAAVRRVVERLDRESLVERRAPGVVAVPSWLDLLRRWNDDAHFTQQVHLSYWRTTRNPHALLERIAVTPVRHAVTGCHAAQSWAPSTPAGPLVVYTPDARAAATLWDLTPARRTSVILAEPRAKSVYTRSRRADSGLRLAAPAQVLADLLTGATRSPSDAEPLTDWMLEHELEWRY
ncbi:hypothetical protein [Kribbella sp. NPDC048915]|uniref:hypothetical protein n=1 Tax=Kribbella sp. NPDC048915 TaxID=3155148 RepID=UPI0033C4C5C4